MNDLSLMLASVMTGGAGMAAGGMLDCIQRGLLRREQGGDASPLTSFHRADTAPRRRTVVLTGVLWTLFLMADMSVLRFSLNCFLSMGLWCAGWVDAKTYRIPDEAAGWVMAAGLWWVLIGGISPASALAGLLLIPLPLLLVSAVWGGFGGGDIKLLVGITLCGGLWQGLQILGIAMILVLLLEGRQKRVPLGPYLAMAAIFVRGAGL